jgi:hypothetical protein
MVTLLIIVMLVVSIAVSKTRPRIAGILDLAVASLILFSRVIPGTAGILDWIFMILFFLGGVVFCFSRKVSMA